MKAILIAVMVLVAGTSYGGRVKPKVVNLSTEEVLAKTLYLEAANQSTEGKVAVAAVIWNRAGGKASEMKKVVLAPKQFSCWNRRSPASVRIKDDLSYRICQVIAREMVSGRFVMPRGLEVATHYHEKSVRPSWGRAQHLLVKIGDHLFYRIVEV